MPWMTQERFWLFSGRLWEIIIMPHWPPKTVLAWSIIMPQWPKNRFWQTKLFFLPESITGVVWSDSHNSQSGCFVSIQSTWRITSKSMPGSSRVFDFVIPMPLFIQNLEKSLLNLLLADILQNCLLWMDYEGTLELG
jgi:hypothetical protein